MIIFEGRHIRVRFRAAKNRQNDCIVAAFHGRLPTPGFQTANFGETFLDSRGYDAVHIQTDYNNWYQSPDIGHALEAAARHMAPYPRRATYGSSMGGYAAVAFSGPLDVHAVAAFVPQATSCTDLSPWETRWRDERDKVIPVMDDLPAQIATGARIFVSYDPMHKLDRQHVGMIEAAAPVEHLKFPLTDHDVLRFIAEAGLQEAIPLDCLAGTASHARYREQVRARRHESSAYYFYAGHYANRLRRDVGLRWKLWLSALDLPSGQQSFYQRILDAAPPANMIPAIARIVALRQENEALQKAYAASPLAGTILPEGAGG